MITKRNIQRRRKKEREKEKKTKRAAKKNIFNRHRPEMIH
jgi:hypothetical protein